MPSPQRHESDLGDRVTRAEAAIVTFGEKLTGFGATLEMVVRVLNERKVPNWGMIVTVSGLGLTMALATISGIYLALSAQQEAAASEQEKAAIRAELEMVRYIQPVVVSSEQSKADRGMLHDRVQDNNTKLTALAGKVDAHYAEARATVAEIEAQFRNVGNTQNIRYQETSRLLGLLWQKTYNEQLPAPTFFPDVHRDIMQR